jgi:very-short-patch-repair endonuclease
LSRGTKGQRCATCRDRSGAANPFFRKTHTSETRKRMRQAARTRDPSTYRGGGGADPELLSQRRREEWGRRTPEEKEKHLASFIAAGQVHNRRSSKTQIETAVRRMLEEAGIRYRQNVQMGRFNVDFLCGDVVIECFGDFWHCNPRLWAPDELNRSLKMTAREKWEKDAARGERLKSEGFHLHVFGEDEILGDPAGVRKRIRRLLGNDHELPEAEPEDDRLR